MFVLLGDGRDREQEDYLQPHTVSRASRHRRNATGGVVGLGVGGPAPRELGSAQRPVAPGWFRRRRGTGQVRQAQQSVPYCVFVCVCRRMSGGRVGGRGGDL